MNRMRTYSPAIGPRAPQVPRFGATRFAKTKPDLCRQYARPCVVSGTAVDILTSNAVILTRERGKNDKVKEMLDKLGIQSLEVPMVETTMGPDVGQLPVALKSQMFDWVALTSPEAANVFVEGWRTAGKPEVRIGVVGAGTGKVLEATNEPALKPQFTPSVANAEHMGPELPFIDGGNNAVLYPCSAKASTLLQEGLERRGFRITRLNTYNTVTVQSIDAATLDAAKKARVVAIASPSALRAWVEHVGQAHAEQMTVACIGSTSARAAEKLGLKNVVFAEEPGLETFVETIREAISHNE